jgi:enamine deaminase RidA (YjgF/YER057c/UK114 family)
MDEAFIEERLADLGMMLPPPPAAVAAYVPVRIAGSTAYVAGQIPMVDGAVLHPGRVGEDVSVDEAAEAAARAALQALSALHHALGGFGRLLGIAQVGVYIAATPTFTEHAKVGNGASELLVHAMGDAGRHARAAVGVASLPLGASVEVAVVAQIETV